MDNTDITYPINDKEDFIEFVRELYEVFKTNPEKWENNTIELFLEAMAAYAKDIQGYYDNTNQNIDANKASWQVFADILSGARIYE
ncbi:hypothetical protein E0W68_01560 [Flavobacterium salilacus subsp. salilacus]|uniref:DUF7660 family protein n=1 Tax=Flavobacterium TaxID=237 RepID=UPI001075137F|nr:MULTISPECIES: hypothetical protein [Flavobacterium]KAF2519941.1 hypothetical protein E0W68_01560 [Flavobacterium salilacus subsp. salilacus]MBE1614148.1 hypothetical protein [Flavobacterium sp. SaA2.13]